MTPPTDPEQKLEDAFIEEVVSRLQARSVQDGFDQLIVVASPRALGTFRTTAPKTLMTRVIKEVVGDYANADEEQLLAAVAERA